jgi:hypothetical protein
MRAEKMEVVSTSQADWHLNRLSILVKACDLLKSLAIRTNDSLHITPREKMVIVICLCKECFDPIGVLES